MLFSVSNANTYRDHIAGRLMRGPAALLMDGMPGLFSGIKILDVGGVTGLLAEQLGPAVRRFDGHLTIIDSERHLLRHVNAAHRRIVAEPANLPFTDGQFDLVIGNSTLSGRTDVMNEMVELRRVMKPTSILHMSGFLPGSFEELFDLLSEVCEGHALFKIGGRLKDARTEFLSMSEIEEGLQSAGFSIGHISTEERAIHFESGAAALADPLTQLVLDSVLKAGPGSSAMEMLGSAWDSLSQTIDTYFHNSVFPLKIRTVVVTAGCLAES